MKDALLKVIAMTLPYRADPTAWLFVLPMLAGMIWAYTRSADHWIKQLWRVMVAGRASCFGLAHDQAGRLPRRRWVGPVLFWLVFSMLLMGAGVSFGVWAGWVDNGPPHRPKWLENMPETVGPADVELEMGDHAITGHLRPKPSPEANPAAPTDNSP